MKGKRIVFSSAGNAELEDFELPELQAGCVLLKTEYSALSAGTERACLVGMANTSKCFPQYPGYSVSGRIIETGPDVGEFHAGDRIIAYHSNHACHSVKHIRDITRIEDNSISSKDAAFLMIAAMSLQGVRKARIELGEHVLVIGLGLLGLFAVQLAVLDGGFPVTALDLEEQRLRLAIDLGADYAFSPAAEDFTEKFKKIADGKGANVVIEATGMSDAMHQALACAARRGRIIALGCTRNPVERIDFYQYIHRPGISIIGAHNFVRPGDDSSPGYWTMQDDLKILLKLLAAGRIRVSPMIHRTVSPEDAPAVYSSLAENSRSCLGVVFDWRNLAV